jgi:hypothetical protein
MMESFDSPFNVPSVRKAMSGRLVVVGVVKVTVPFIAVLTLESVSLLASILDPIMSVSVADDVLKISLTIARLIWCL